MRRLCIVLLACIVLAVMASGCSGHVKNAVSPNNTSDHSWPRLFDVINLSWFKYDMINSTTGTLERNLTIWYGEDPNVHVNLSKISGGAPVTVTNVRIYWLNINRRYESETYTTDSDGVVIYSYFWMMNNGTPHSLVLVPWGNPFKQNPSTARLDAGDLVALFDDGMGPGLHVSGFDFLQYNGSYYYCSVYESYNDSTFRAWHNASFPVPLKITASIGNQSIIEGRWTFLLSGWG